jgi:hypothetical protein
VTEALGGGVEVIYDDNGSSGHVEERILRPTPPAKKDRVKIVGQEGTEDSGAEGTLVGVDGNDGIMKEGNGGFKIVDMSSLCKLAA